MLRQVSHHRPLTRVAETGHAVLHVGEEALAGLLAVVADVDAGLELFPDDVTHSGFGLAREGGGLDGFPVVLAHEQIAKRRRPRKTAGMRGQDAVVAALRIASSGRRAGLSRDGLGKGMGRRVRLHYLRFLGWPDRFRAAAWT